MGTYSKRIQPSAAAIGDATDNYEIAYVPGMLIINEDKDATPGTGDNTKTLLWTSLMLTSAVGCGGALWIAGRKKKEER